MLTPGGILRESLLLRQAKNASYSLRSMARSLGISPSYLSLVFSDRRAISMKRADAIVEKLKFSPQERAQFLRAVALHALPSRTRALLSGELESPEKAPDPFEGFTKFAGNGADLLAHWYYPAILDLTTCRGFESSPEWIAERLNLPLETTAGAVTQLAKLGLLSIDQVPWRKTSKLLYYPSRKSQPAVRRFHAEMSRRAAAVLEHPRAAETFATRSMTGLTLAVNPRYLALARRLIARMESRLTDTLTVGNCTEVYHLNIQLFPLTAPATRPPRSPRPRHSKSGESG